MDTPLVSILVPIRNEKPYLQRCLQAVLAQDYPSNRLEVLIADGLSTDGTRSLVQAFQSEHPFIQFFENPGKIVPTGLNILIPKAKGDILIRVDGHCVIAPDYVTNCVRHLQADGTDGVGGPMKTIGEDLTSEITALAMSSTFGVGNSSFRTQVGQTKLADTVPFPAYTSAIIKKVGLYDEELVRNQDDEYNYRIREADGKILLAADVQSTYFSRGSFSKLWRQYFQYGFWKVRVLQKHPRQMSLRQFVPPLFVLALLISLVLAPALPRGWLVLAGLLALYLFANILASILTGRGHPLSLTASLPLAFTILHVSYGLGFLIGLVKFANRWGDKLGKVPPWPL